MAHAGPLSRRPGSRRAGPRHRAPAPQVALAAGLVSPGAACARSANRLILAGKRASRQTAWPERPFAEPSSGAAAGGVLYARPSEQISPQHFDARRAASNDTAACFQSVAGHIRFASCFSAAPADSSRQTPFHPATHSCPVIGGPGRGESAHNSVCSDRAASAPLSPADLLAKCSC